MSKNTTPSPATAEGVLQVLGDYAMQHGEPDDFAEAIRTVGAMAGALADCREALRRAGAAGELAVVDAALAAFGSAPAPSAWQPKPTEAGWYWHFDGDVMRMEFVFQRPGHSYLAVQEDAHPITGKRHFHMAEKIGGKWFGPLPVPTPPSAAPTQEQQE